MIGISRNVLRCHDTPFFNCEKIIILFDKSRFPSLKIYENKIESYKFSIPQCYFYLNAIKRHMYDLKRLGYSAEFVLSDNIDNTIQKISKKYKTVITDRVEDPAYIKFDESMRKYMNVKFYTSNTLVDWENEEHITVSKNYFVKAFKKTKKMKEYIIENIREKYPSFKKKSNKGKLVGIDDVEELIKQLEKIATSLEIHLYPFDIFDSSSVFDDEVLRIAKKMANRVKSSDWFKPKTARNLGLLQHPKQSKYDTSKMSPFLSNGILSVHTFLNLLKTNDTIITKMGSACDQLLFRECWYAVAVSDRISRDKFWSNQRGWWDPNNKYKSPTPTHSTLQKSWKNQSSEIQNWIYGTMNASWIDANESMKLLFKTGWIHHLRRHLVADVLCRGELEQHFIFGENWFRQTLIDHDAVINRANWMWLSATAFSTKQSYLHYKPTDYIQRGSIDAFLESHIFLKKK